MVRILFRDGKVIANRGRPLTIADDATCDEPLDCCGCQTIIECSGLTYPSALKLNVPVQTGSTIEARCWEGEFILAERSVTDFKGYDLDESTVIDALIACSPMSACAAYSAVEDGGVLVMGNYVDNDGEGPCCERVPFSGAYSNVSGTRAVHVPMWTVNITPTGIDAYLIISIANKTFASLSDCAEEDDFGGSTSWIARYSSPTTAEEFLAGGSAALSLAETGALNVCGGLYEDDFPGELMLEFASIDDRANKICGDPPPWTTTTTPEPTTTTASPTTTTAGPTTSTTTTEEPTTTTPPPPCDIGCNDSICIGDTCYGQYGTGGDICLWDPDLCPQCPPECAPVTTTTTTTTTTPEPRGACCYVELLICDENQTEAECDPMNGGAWFEGFTCDETGCIPD